MTTTPSTTYRIRYLSGRQFHLTGTFRLLPILGPGRLMSPVIIEPGDRGQAHVLDPRAVVTDAAGHTVYRGCSTADLDRDNAR